MKMSYGNKVSKVSRIENTFNGEGNLKCQIQERRGLLPSVMEWSMTRSEEIEPAKVDKLCENVMEATAL